MPVGREDVFLVSGKRVPNLFECLQLFLNGHSFDFRSFEHIRRVKDQTTIAKLDRRDLMLLACNARAAWVGSGRDVVDIEIFAGAGGSDAVAVDGAVGAGGTVGQRAAGD